MSTNRLNLALKNGSSTGNNQATRRCITSTKRPHTETDQCHEEKEINDKQIKPITYKLYQKFLAELSGTCLLLFIGGGGPVFCEGNLVASALGAGFVVTTTVYIFYKISGAHFNPAISIPLYLRNLLPLKDMLLYILAQFIGAFIGCILIALCRKGKFDKLGATKVQNYIINLGKEQKLDSWCYVSALACEFICTFILILFGFSVSEKNNKLGNTVGLGYGVLLVMLILIGANVSGSSFNPARALAQAVLQAIGGGDKEPLKQIWIFFVGPMGGGILAAFYWKIFEI